MCSANDPEGLALYAAFNGVANASDVQSVYQRLKEEKKNSKKGYKPEPPSPVTKATGKVTQTMIEERMAPHIGQDGTCLLSKEEQWHGMCLNTADMKYLVGSALGVNNTHYVRPILYEATRQGVISPDELKKAGYNPDSSTLQNNNSKKSTTTNRTDTESYEAITRTVQAAIRKQYTNPFSMDGPGLWVKLTFPDAVIIQMDDGSLWEIPYTINDDGSVDLGEPTQVTEQYTSQKAAEHGLDVRPIIGLIVNKNEPQRVAYAAVAVPGEPDSDGEILTPEEIEYAAHKWMENYRNMDIMHTFKNVANPVESYILPQEMTVKAYDQEMTLPQGTWIVGSHITDDDTWQKVQKGELRGHSLTGVRGQLAAAKSTIPNLAGKRTLIKDLGDYWEAATVSIVDTPAVPKALFFALKSKPPEQGKPGLVRKAGRTISDATLNSLKTIVEHAQRLIKVAEDERSSNPLDNLSLNRKKPSKDVSEVLDMDENELKKLIKTGTESVIKSELKPIKTDIETLKSAQKAGSAGMVCPKCGAEYDDPNTKFCPADGTKLEPKDDNSAGKSDGNVQKKQEELEKEIKALKEENRTFKKKLGIPTEPSSLGGQDGDPRKPSPAQKSFYERIGCDTMGRPARKVKEA